MKSEAANQQLRNEVELMRTVQRRLQTEADSAKSDSSLQLQMLSNLQRIQSSIEQTNGEMKEHYRQRLEQADNDKVTLKKQMEMLQQQIQSADSLHSAEAASWSTKHEQLNQELARSTERLNALTEEHKALKQVSRQVTL